MKQKNSKNMNRMDDKNNFISELIDNFHHLS